MFINLKSLSMKHIFVILVAVAILSVVLLVGLVIGLVELIRIGNPESFTLMLRHLKIVILMLMCEIPYPEPLDTQPVQLIPVYFNAWVYAGKSRGQSYSACRG